MANKQSGSLANPTRLKPIKKQDGILQVIVETPKGCRNKFAFDAEQRIFALKKVLPAGTSRRSMTFPSSSCASCRTSS